jgi:hypothetical protein
MPQGLLELLPGLVPGTSSPMATPTGPKPTVINSKVAADPLGEDKPWSTPLPRGISPGEAKGTHAVNPYRAIILSMSMIGTRKLLNSGPVMVLCCHSLSITTFAPPGGGHCLLVQSNQ